MNNWRTIPSEELWEYTNTDKNAVWTTPKFPTNRWGKIYLEESTTDIDTVNKLILKLKGDGFTVRKRIDKKTNRGTFYRIDIKNHPERIYSQVAEMWDK